MPTPAVKQVSHIDVAVELEVPDVVKASCAVFVRRARYAIAAYVALLLATLILLEKPGGVGVLPLEVLRPLAISLILLPAFFFGFVYWNTKLQFERSAPKARTMRYRFRADSLDVQSTVRGGFLPWFAIHEAIETKSSFLLFLSPNEHYLIPKRCFREPAEVETVRELLREGIGSRFRH